MTGHATPPYLPPRFEDDRELIESQLPAFDGPGETGGPDGSDPERFR